MSDTDDLLDVMKESLDNFPRPLNFILRQKKLEFDLFYINELKVRELAQKSDFQTIGELGKKCKSVGLNYEIHRGQRLLYLQNCNFLISLFITEKLSDRQAKALLLQNRSILIQKKQAYGSDILINNDGIHNTSFELLSRSEIDAVNFNDSVPLSKFNVDYQLKEIDAFLLSYEHIEPDFKFSDKVRATAHKMQVAKDHVECEKKFLDYLNFDKKEELGQKLIDGFTNKEGKYLKVLITVLINHGVLKIGDRQFSQFYEAMKSFFPWYIGTYQSIQNYKVRLNEGSTDKKLMTEIESKIKTILSELTEN